LYLGQRSGKITVLAPPRYRVVSSESSDVGSIFGFSGTSYGIFAFGAEGIALRQNGGFRRLSFADPAFSMTVTGLVEDRDGNIWVNGTRAIARVSSAEMSAAASDRSHRIRAREFHEGEYRGSDYPRSQRNSAQIDSQGRIWFPTANGVIYIDPNYVDRPPHVPRVSIRSISADGGPLGVNRSFPAKTQTLNVHYFGLDLSDPMAVVYRYKLEGSDKTWQDAGQRTEAIYTHLRPAKYIFRVMASEGGAVWSQPVDSEAFTVLPAFYQTWWFDALSASMGTLLLWIAFCARTRHVTATVRMRAEERASERVRIARELHDTLLQGVQGLLLCFHVAAEKVPDSHEAKEALEKALATAEQIILEARDRVNRLRSERPSPAEFEASIEAVAVELSRLSKIDFSMERTGEQRDLKPEVFDEVFYIAREALTNAFRHSAATRIILALDYGRKQILMECRDNGRGFDRDKLKQAEAGGHWGLNGMEERARSIGAEFSYDSAPGSGTRIRLVVAARRAYIDGISTWRVFRRDP
jgi:signal transduction histidine kinase